MTQGQEVEICVSRLRNKTKRKLWKRKKGKMGDSKAVLSLSRLLPSEEVILLDDKKFHIQTAMVVATV